MAFPFYGFVGNGLLQLRVPCTILFKIHIMNSSINPKAFILFLLSLALLCSCSIPEKKVSKEEALALSHRIELSLTKHDYSVLNNIFDEKALASRIATEGGLFLNKDLIKGGVQGFITEQFGKLVVQAM